MIGPKVDLMWLLANKYSFKVLIRLGSASLSWDMRA